MDFSKLMGALEKGVQFAEEMAPALGALTPYAGVAETAANAIAAVTEVVQNVQQRIEDGSIVAHSDDQDQVRQMAQRLHDINDGLAEQIDKS